MKTIKEIADELGIEKQKVYRFIKKNQIQEVNQEYINEVLQKNNVKYYDDAAESIIKRGLYKERTSKEAHQNCINEAENEVLLTQIEMLKKELEEKNNQINTLLCIVNQAQKLQAISEQKIKVLEQNEPEKQRKQWWKFWK